MGGLNGLAWRGLRARPLRTGLTVAGVALGVAVLFAGLATNAGIEAAVDRAVSTLVGQADLLGPGRPLRTLNFGRRGANTADEAAMLDGLSHLAIIRKIIFPQLLPHILASMRYALGICWKICTTVELIGMSSGVGYQLNYWFGLFSMAQVFAWTLLFLLVMFAIEYLLFKPLEKRLTRWRTGVPALQWAQ